MNNSQLKLTIFSIVSGFLWSCKTPSEKGGNSSLMATPDAKTYQVGADSYFRETNLSYSIAMEENITNCQFYIDRFGKGEFAQGSMYRHWFSAIAKTGKDFNMGKTKILNFGALISFKGRSVSPGQLKGYFLAHKSDSSEVLKLDVNNLFKDGQKVFHYDLNEISFFLDVQTNTAATESEINASRLWLKDANNEFSGDAIFNGHPTEKEDLNFGFISWLSGSSPIYSQKDLCLPR